MLLQIKVALINLHYFHYHGCMMYLQDNNNLLNCEVRKFVLYNGDKQKNRRHSQTPCDIRYSARETTRQSKMLNSGRKCQINICEVPLHRLIWKFLERLDRTSWQSEKTKTEKLEKVVPEFQ